MPRYIIKLTDNKTKVDYYLEWSTVVDAPVTYGLSLEEFKAYYEKEYGRRGMWDLEDRLKRVEEKGTSAHPPFDNLSSMLNTNRAGEDGKRLTREQLLDKYCLNQDWRTDKTDA